MRQSTEVARQDEQEDGQQDGQQGEASTAPQENLLKERGQPSPAKRARPQEPGVKVMPLNYETCDVMDLGVLISEMLMELINVNDKLKLRDAELTRFHSR